jgi:hypothetical protein
VPVEDVNGRECPLFLAFLFFLKYLQKPNPARALILYWFRFHERLRE